MPNLVDKVGFELEFAGDRGRLQREIEAAGIPVNSGSYGEWAENTVIVKTDGSVSNGGEMATMPFTFNKDGMKFVQTLLKAVRKAGCTTCDSAGLHVHVDAEGLSHDAIAQVAAAAIRFEDSNYRLASSGWPELRSHIFEYAPPFNRSTKAELLVSDFNPAGVLEILRNTGRGGVNFSNAVAARTSSSRRPKNTIEFRLFNSSTNAERIWADIALGIGTVRAAQLDRLKKPKISLENVFPLGAMAHGKVDEKQVLMAHMRVLNTAVLPTLERNLIKKHWIYHAEPQKIRSGFTGYEFPGYVLTEPEVVTENLDAIHRCGSCGADYYIRSLHYCEDCATDYATCPDCEYCRHC